MVRDPERNEPLLAIIEGTAVNHRDPRENEFLEESEGHPDPRSIH